MKIWYQSTLDFAQHPNYAKALAAHFQKIARSETAVLLHGRVGDHRNHLPASEIIGSPSSIRALSIRPLFELYWRQRRRTQTPFFAASFSEPILPGLRGLAKILVVSMSEACFVAATTSAPKVGFVTLNKHIIHYIEKSISLHKRKDRVSGIHLINGDTSETELDAKLSEPGPFLERLAARVRDAVSSGAQSVIVAEGVLGMMAAENRCANVCSDKYSYG